MGGNLVLVNLDGDIIWDRQLSGKIITNYPILYITYHFTSLISIYLPSCMNAGTLPHTPTVGDVDGDGELDIVVVTVNEDGSHLWVVAGNTGIPLKG
jgi:hypothetical protein